MKYPEHDKLSIVHEKSQAIGEFIETSGFVLAKSHECQQDYFCEDEEGNCAFGKAGLEPVHMSTEKILAEYFELDLKKLEEEKRAMLKELQKATR